jgi:YggT family protein
MDYYIYTAIRVVEGILLFRIILSWLRLENSNEVTRQICKVVDPILEPIRNALPVTFRGIDFSPMILFVILDVAKGFFLYR